MCLCRCSGLRDFARTFQVLTTGTELVGQEVEKCTIQGEEQIVQGIRRSVLHKELMCRHDTSKCPPTRPNFRSTNAGKGKRKKKVHSYLFR